MSGKGISMQPERVKKVIYNECSYLVEEYYWAGEMVVYVDNVLNDLSFDEAVSNPERIRNNVHQSH